MCHKNSLAALPTPGNHSVKRDSGLKYWQYGAGSNQRLAIITDIYGCNDFYQSFATHFAQQGWAVDLIDLFSDLGELPEITREAAFARRHKLSDADICNKLEAFIDEQSVDAVIGFCLGGNYVFEMSRRNVDVRKHCFYQLRNTFAGVGTDMVHINDLAKSRLGPPQFFAFAKCVECVEFVAKDF